MYILLCCIVFDSSELSNKSPLDLTSILPICPIKMYYQFLFAVIKFIQVVRL